MWTIVLNKEFWETYSNVCLLSPGWMWIASECIGWWIVHWIHFVCAAATVILSSSDEEESSTANEDESSEEEESSDDDEVPIVTRSKTSRVIKGMNN